MPAPSFPWYRKGQVMAESLRVVHYVNQFFGGVGGEDKANTAFHVKDGPVGPGRALQQALGSQGMVGATFICNWTTQPEKEMAASREALLAKQLGAVGAIVTTDMRGQRFLEEALTVQACERLGISTVLLTKEEDNEGGAAPPLLVSFPRACEADPGHG